MRVCRADGFAYMPARRPERPRTVLVPVPTLRRGIFRVLPDSFVFGHELILNLKRWYGLQEDLRWFPIPAASRQEEALALVARESRLWVPRGDNTSPIRAFQADRVRELAVSCHRRVVVVSMPVAVVGAIAVIPQITMPNEHQIVIHLRRWHLLMDEGNYLGFQFEGQEAARDVARAATDRAHGTPTDVARLCADLASQRSDVVPVALAA